MHVIIGLLGLVAVLIATVAGEGSQTFTGYLHRPALLLLLLAPPFVALTSYRPRHTERAHACQGQDLRGPFAVRG